MSGLLNGGNRSITLTESTFEVSIMAIDNHTEVNLSILGVPCQLRPGAEDQAVLLLRVVERLPILTDFDPQNCDVEHLRNRLNTCHQQHQELAVWVGELLMKLDSDNRELFEEEQQVLSLAN